jgi:hypothetical protein
MTKPEAVTQEDNEAANSILYCVMENSFDTEGRFKLDMEKVAQAFARHRIAAEQRGMDRKLLCAREAFTFWFALDALDGSYDSSAEVGCSIRAIELWEEGFGK